MTATMRALEVRTSPHRVLWAKAAGGLRDDAFYGGTGSPLQLREIPVPERPPGWVRIATRLGGICASDFKFLRIDAPSRKAFAFFGWPTEPVVLGHEVVGTVLDADDDADVSPGDRVVAENLLPCAEKGFDACDRCARGDIGRCAHFADRGTRTRDAFTFGFHRRYGGGWAQQLVAPAALVHRVPDELDDRSAVLAEPVAIGVHAVLSGPPRGGARVLVIGPGGVGLTLSHALTALVPDVELTVAGLSDAADAHARRAGATHVLHGTRQELVESAGQLLGTTIRGNAVSGPVLEHGFDVVYDTVGNEQTIDDALRMLRPGGELVLIATAPARRIDLFPFWHRELTLRGVSYYTEGVVPDGARIAAGRRREMRIALDVLAQDQPGHLVTHVFPLEESVEALRTAAAGPAAAAVRVAFAPNG